MFASFPSGWWCFDNPMIADHPFLCSTGCRRYLGANMLWLAGCTDVWRAGDPNGDCRRSFSGVLKVCVPKRTGFICVLITLISLSL